MLFQRLMQLFWPHNKALQEELRVSMRNGASADTKDPLYDKMSNCGTMVLTFSYWTIDDAVTVIHRSDAEIVDVRWLFGGRMESAVCQDDVPPGQPEAEPFEDVNDFLGEVTPTGTTTPTMQEATLL
mmetsp:Transcript_126141/g.403726  ORF Transcript_126141/g.403726 Transcript_126141/m.403726 type:complete len:127 (-) Transcript_126141:59-439(-)